MNDINFTITLANELVKENYIVSDVLFLNLIGYASKSGLYSIQVNSKNRYEDACKIRDYLLVHGFKYAQIENNIVISSQIIICSQKDIQNLVTLYKMKGVMS
jgi:hypothetical protein